MSARYIRFHPTKRNKWNCLRVEIYGVSSKPVKSTQVLSFLNYWHSHMLGISHFFNIYIYPWWNFWWTSSKSMQSSTAVLGVTEKVHDIGSSSGLGTTQAKTYSFWTQQETGTLNISGRHSFREGGCEAGRNISLSPKRDPRMIKVASYYQSGRN